MSMNAGTSNTNPIWATIGKAGTFLSLIVALLTLYAQINPDKANVFATCNVVEVLIPPKEPKAPESSADSAILEESQLRNPQSALQCKVVNNGRQEAKDVVLDMPIEATAASKNGKPLLRPYLSENSIALGTLRPNGKLEIVVWFASNGIYSVTEEKGYSLSFSGGIGSVQLWHPTLGWIASVARFLEFVTEDPLSFLLLITALLVTATLLALIGMLLFAKKANPSLNEQIAVNRDTQELKPSDQNEIAQIAVPRSRSTAPTTEAKGDWRD